LWREHLLLLSCGWFFGFTSATISAVEINAADFGFTSSASGSDLTVRTSSSITTRFCHRVGVANARIASTGEIHFGMRMWNVNSIDDQSATSGKTRWSRALRWPLNE